jgi:hypothetical protein
LRQIQISESCGIYISNSVSNWKFDQWRKLFVFILSIRFKFLMIFGGKEDSVFYF